MLPACYPILSSISTSEWNASIDLESAKCEENDFKGSVLMSWEGRVLWKRKMLGIIAGSRKRRIPNMKWTDSIREATGASLQELSSAVEGGALWTSPGV